MVPGMPADFAQIQKAQAETPCPVRLGQPFEEVRDGLGLGAALRAVTKAGLTDPERPAGQRNAAPPLSPPLLRPTRGVELAGPGKHRPDGPKARHAIALRWTAQVGLIRLLDDMWRHFRKFARVQDQDGKRSYLRFWKVGWVRLLFHDMGRSEAGFFPQC